MDLTARLVDDQPALGDARACDAVWAASGAMALTGRADGPALLVGRGAVRTLAGLAAALARRTEALGVPVHLDGPALLGERAALGGLVRRGRTSVGGSTRLLRAADGWVAVALPRADDAAFAGAWLGGDASVDADDPWPDVASAVVQRPTRALAADAALVGLAVGALGECRDERLAIATRHGDAPPVADVRGLVVADLTGLWAGPLCADLLGRAGAHVRKVESVGRPDGARFGDPAFFALLNTGKEELTIDFRSDAGLRTLRDVLAGADVVLESARPRALAQLGIVSAELLADPRTRPRVWCSITGYGRGGEHGHRVGFGDDAAVAGGLVGLDGDRRPVFCADAAADAATGLTAAGAIVERLAAGGRWLVDVALARTAAHLASGAAPARPDEWDGAVAAPSARSPRPAR